MLKRLTIAAVALSLPFAALAGEKLTANMAVTVDLTSRTASGQTAVTRATKDNVALIGCTVGAIGASGIPYAICEAKDAKGNYLSCESGAAGYIQAAAAVNGDSYIYFASDANGSCTQITVNNGSAYAPKQN
jgi:hypothetical protein